MSTNMLVTTVLTFLVATCQVTSVAEKTEEQVSVPNGVHSIALYAGENGYAHRVVIGSGQKQFTVIVSMRSPMLWIPSVACTTSACMTKSRFNHSQSSTFKNDTGAWSQKTYGAVSGFHGKDTVRIGASNENQLSGICIFGLATDMSDAFKNWPGVDGVLGLGISRDSGIPSDPFLQQLVTVQILKPAMFTVYLRHSQASTSAGVVTYGSTDSTNCVPRVDYHLVSTNTFIKIKTISMGAIKINQTSMMPELVPAILGPMADVQKIADKVGAKLVNNRYEIRCNASLPNFEFMIENTKYTIASDKLITKTITGCALALNFAQNSLPGSPQWYFGAPLFMQYCVTFDYTGKRLGFASVKSSHTTTLKPPTTRFSNSTYRPVTTIRSTTKRKKLAPVIHYAGIFVSILIALIM